MRTSSIISMAEFGKFAQCSLDTFVITDIFLEYINGKQPKFNDPK